MQQQDTKIEFYVFYITELSILGLVGLYIFLKNSLNTKLKVRQLNRQSFRVERSIFNTKLKVERHIKHQLKFKGQIKC